MEMLIPHLRTPRSPQDGRKLIRLNFSPPSGDLGVLKWKNSLKILRPRAWQNNIKNIKIIAIDKKLKTFKNMSISTNNRYFHLFY